MSLDKFLLQKIQFLVLGYRPGIIHTRKRAVLRQVMGLEIKLRLCRVSSRVCVHNWQQQSRLFLASFLNYTIFFVRDAVNAFTGYSFVKMIIFKR